MPIDRAGPVPPYWQYLVEYPLIPNAQPAGNNILALQNAGLRWLYIPTYQRGISWEPENVDEFLQSESVLLGNVIIGRFPRAEAPLLRYLPDDQAEYYTLVDGLQRLAVGTILLNLLHADFLAPEPNKPHEAAHFTNLRALIQNRAAAYLHNDHEFRNHPRQAISNQYTRLRTEMQGWLAAKIQDEGMERVAALVTKLMTIKQVAIDVYFNFPNTLDLMATFLGLNAVRVDLGPVDFVRSTLVEKASSVGWNQIAVEQLENSFTDIFTRNGSQDSMLKPFINAVDTVVRRLQSPQHVFPTWSTRLDESEVSSFLQFVSDCKETANNPYFNEIRECGSLPFGIALAFYYKRFLRDGHRPEFLSGGVGDDEDLHDFLRGVYRLMLDGRVGRAGGYLQKALTGDLTTGHYKSLSEIGNAMSQEALGRDLRSRVDEGWLRTTLTRVDKVRAKRVFNAMLLHDFASGRGGSFQPLKYGRAARDFQVDHLIPNSMLRRHQPGHSEGQGIRNFAPLPANQNNVANNTNCSTKLGSGGIYPAHVMAGDPVHPYVRWLVEDHVPRFGTKALDDQKLLEPNQTPAVGDERLEKIVADLLPRL